MTWPETLSRLGRWSDDVRIGNHPYSNPGDLREDVRWLLAEYDHVCEMLDNVMSTLNVEYDDMFPDEDDLTIRQEDN